MKYAPLKAFLDRQTVSEIAMTFAEIEQTIGQALPSSASKYPAWWSNNPSNNVMTKAWLEAGFKTERVDLASQRLVFRRARSPSSGQAAKPAASSLEQIYGALRGAIRLRPDVDLTEPTDEIWDAEVS